MKKIIIILSVCSCCFLFTGCTAENTVSSNGGIGAENIRESELQKMDNKLPEIEPVVEDNWPDSIGRENENTTAENLSFDIQISNPMVLYIACVTESGKLNMEITSSDGERIFSASDIQTENFEVTINSSGTYKVIIQAKEHTGSFLISTE
ncbi:MAG: hypothetical protein NC433_06975 [Clostridiales bacterium]|nr:hypothetical protein [Clostridiales bacterium]